MLLTIILTLLAASIFFLFRNSTKSQTYWKDRGVYTPKTLPILGHSLQPLLLKVNIADWINIYYRQIDKPYFGLYFFDDPYFIAKDPKMIKSILVQDFNHFQDRNIAAPEHSPLHKNLLGIQKSPEWKPNRAKVSVVFSSGKLKMMFPFFIKTNQRMAEFLKNNYRPMEASDFVFNYATDVISLCAFGIDTHCFNDLTSPFKAYGKKMFNFTIRNALIQTIYFLKPKWVNKFKLDFISKDCMDYFSKIFLETIRSRSDRRKVGDLIDILNDMKNDPSSYHNEDYACSMAIQFLFAGYETTSSVISFTLYELAKNIEIQDRLREEIRSVIKLHGDLTYEAVSNMKYLDMCIAESLRIYPPLPFLERKCNKDYKIPNFDVVIEKGCVVMIPMLALHMDERYFPEPHKFDPERFINNIDNSNGIYYFPYGSGPRNCIGARFGKLSTKMALITILLNSEVTFCKDTPDPIEFTAKCFFLRSKVGLPLMFNPLTK